MTLRKILCLHGSGTSAAILQHQMRRLSLRLKQDLSLDTHFAQAELITSAAPGVGEVFEGPYYSWFSWTEPPSEKDLESVQTAYQHIYDIIEDEGPFEGILGFSQGATLASAFLLQHAKNNPWDLPFAHFKYAILIAGTPPRTSSMDNALPPSDQSIILPTVHVIGKLDQACAESLDLARVCRKDAASIILHDEGHVVPKDAVVLQNIVAALREVYRSSALEF